MWLPLHELHMSSKHMTHEHETWLEWEVFTILHEHATQPRVERVNYSMMNNNLFSDFIRFIQT